MFLNAIVLTLSPSVRLHSWDVDYRWAHWLGFTVWLVGFSLIHRLFSRKIPERDPYILPVCAMLSGWGLLTIWRLDNNFGWRQTLWLGICLLAIWAGLRIPNLLILLRRYKYLWLTSGLLLTALTFFFGTYPEGIGPRLWLGCCGIYLQPSEPLKLLLIIYLAAYLADRLPISFNLAQLLIPTLVLVGIALLILLAQRDLGTASLFLVLYFIIIYLASGSWRVLLLGLGTIMIAGIAGYLMFDVIRLRIEAWLNPWLDPSGRSYQIVQSILAMAAGRVFGRGLGLGNPALVPISHSDFIFAAIAEESGLAGSLGILLLLGILTIRGILIALKAPNNYQRYLAAGLSAYLATQGILIIGGTNRLFPLTGVTLPFVSYGGSSLLTAFLSILILSRISSHSELQPAPLPQSRPYLFLGAVTLTSLAVLGLINGWWSIVRAD
ncbi:MAG: FtsW/RodA/SpoVE family cell cycle protein, partial [Anaerolineales bacterium]